MDNAVQDIQLSLSLEHLVLHWFSLSSGANKGYKLRIQKPPRDTRSLQQLLSFLSIPCDQFDSALPDTPPPLSLFAPAEDACPASAPLLLPTLARCYYPADAKHDACRCRQLPGCQKALSRRGSYALGWGVEGPMQPCVQCGLLSRSH